MGDIISSQEFLKIITLADIRFYIAIALMILWTIFQSRDGTFDSYFRQLNFYIGLVWSLVVLLANTWMSYYAASQSYRPILINSTKWDEISELIANKQLSIDAEFPISLVVSMMSAVGSAIAMSMVIFVIGVASYIYHPPIWHRGRGIDIPTSRPPDVVNYTILTVMMRCGFQSMVVLFLAILSFDVVTWLAKCQSETGISHIKIDAKACGGNVGSILDFFKSETFDQRFFVVLGISVFVIPISIGKIWLLHLRMHNDTLGGYQPKDLRRYVLQFRRYQRAIRPGFRVKLREDTNLAD